MSQSSYMKKRGGNTITKKMITERLDSLATLCTSLETTLMEWEIWFRLLKTQRKFLTAEQFESFIQDGPIFTDITSKIMESIRNQMPEFKKDENADQPVKPAILGADGNVAQSNNKIIEK